MPRLAVCSSFCWNGESSPQQTVQQKENWTSTRRKERVDLVSVCFGWVLVSFDGHDRFIQSHGQRKQSKWNRRQA